jgi:beta-xylosidase
MLGAVFTTTDPFHDASWSEAVTWDASSIDPDLFWDEDGTIYMISAGIILQTIDLSSGLVSTPTTIWNGTGGSSPEGPHTYKKDGWYYLTIAEAGPDSTTGSPSHAREIFPARMRRTRITPFSPTLGRRHISRRWGMRIYLRIHAGDGGQWL